MAPHFVFAAHFERQIIKLIIQMELKHQVEK